MLKKNVNDQTPDKSLCCKSQAFDKRRPTTYDSDPDDERIVDALMLHEKDPELQEDTQRNMAEEIVTNHPHPSLEYPILYFFLRRCPWLFDRIKIFYAFRWRLSYPLQRKVPYSRVLRKIGIYLTWGELLLILPFFAAIVAGILYTVVFPSVVVTGKIARFGLIGALLFAQRNSLVTLLLGIPFDRAVFYHKLSGRVGGIVGLLHTVAYFVDPVFRSKHQFDALSGAFTGQANISGSVLMLLIAAITLSSLPPVRRRLFEVFYYLHVLFTAGMITCAFFHSGILVPILALLTWGTDVFIRSIVMARTRYPRKAQVKAISETVVEISFPKTSAFAYNPGQYIYLAIPEISWLQWHPFSISSSPDQQTVTLHVRKSGNWTSALFELAKEKASVSLLLEGPYGNLSIDIMGGKKYKNILLLSGGIGITPMQSICDSLLNESSKNRRALNRIKFVWVERDPVLIQRREFVKCASSTQTAQSIEESSMSSESTKSRSVLGVVHDHEAQPSISIAPQVLMLPATTTTDDELEIIYASSESLLDQDDEMLDGSKFEDKAVCATSDPSPTKTKSGRLEVLDIQVYLTSRNAHDLSFATHGRPNIKKLFLEMRQEAITSGDNRVAVCVSAPRKLTHLCRRACIVYSDNVVRFDFHAEPMTL